MPVSILLSGIVAPLLFLLSPAGLASARDCLDWNPPAKAAPAKADKPCRRPPLM